jgi:hypothetical protein
MYVCIYVCSMSFLCLCCPAQIAALTLVDAVTKESYKLTMKQDIEARNTGRNLAAFIFSEAYQ